MVQKYWTSNNDTNGANKAATPAFSDSFEYKAPNRKLSGGGASSGSVPTFNAPAQKQIDFNPQNVEKPTLDLSGIPTTEQITSSASRQYGLLKAISDAASKQEMTSLARRLGGDTSSPVFQAVSGNIAGGAAARTGANISETNARARAEALSAETTRANLGLGLIGAEQNAARINSQNDQFGANFEASRDRDLFDRSSTEANFDLRSNEQQFGQDTKMRELENSEDFVAWQQMMKEKGFSLEESKTMFEQDYVTRQQDYKESEGDRRFDLDTDRFDWDKELGQNKFDLAEDEQNWYQNFNNKNQRFDQNMDVREQNFAEDEADRNYGVNLTNARQGQQQLDQNQQNSVWGQQNKNIEQNQWQQDFDFDTKPFDDPLETTGVGAGATGTTGETWTTGNADPLDEQNSIMDKVFNFLGM